MHFAFSDGNPVRELLVFILIFAVSAYCVRWPRVNCLVSGAVAGIVRLIRTRNALPQEPLLPSLIKLDLARIVTGAIALWRYEQIFQTSFANGDVRDAIISGVATVLASFVMIGLATPLCTFVLMVTANIIIDNFLGASTLGTQLLSMVLLVMFLGPAGRTLSVDAWLAARGGAGERFVRSLHALSGAPSVDRLLFAKFAALICYFCLCLYSVSWHLNDPAWRSGLVLAWIMLTPTSNPSFVDLVWSVYSTIPFTFVNLCRLGLAGMIVWYFLVLPGLFLGRVTRHFVIWWGLAFFLISTFVLPLSYLGWYELVLWFILFASGRPFGEAGAQRLVILFDDRGDFHTGAIRTLSRLDLFRRLEFRPLQANPAFARQHGVGESKGLGGLVAIDTGNGEKYSGYALYETISQRLVALWIIVPFVWLGRVAGLGARVSRWIGGRQMSGGALGHQAGAPARNAFGGSSLYLGPTPGPGPSRLVKAMLITLAVVVIAFVVRLPFGGASNHELWIAKRSKGIFGSSPIAVGIGKINVFNSQDLSFFKLNISYYGDRPGLDLSFRDTLDSLTPKLKYFGSFQTWTMTDNEKYKLMGQARRMSRTNLGCDRAFWETNVSILSRIARRVGAPPRVNFEVSLVGWPTDRELDAYGVASREDLPLCRATIDPAAEKIVALTFVQDGVDRAMVSKGYAPFVRASSFETALRHPCKADGFFLDTLAGAQLPSDPIKEARGELAPAIEGAYGQYEIDCLAHLQKASALAPMILHPESALPSQAACESGIALLTAFSETAGDDADRERGKQVMERARTAMQQGDNGSCTSQVLQERAIRWSGFAKPGSELVRR